MGTNSPGQTPHAYSEPSGPWSVTCQSKTDGSRVPVPAPALVHPGREYAVSVTSLCGGITGVVEGAPMRSMTARDFARACQVAASIGHVTRRGCVACKVAYTNGLTSVEKAMLWSDEPTVGDNVNVGKNGVVLPPTASPQVSVHTSRSVMHDRGE